MGSLKSSGGAAKCVKLRLLYWGWEGATEDETERGTFLDTRKVWHDLRGGGGGARRNDVRAEQFASTFIFIWEFQGKQRWPQGHRTRDRPVMWARTRRGWGTFWNVGEI